METQQDFPEDANDEDDEQTLNWAEEVEESTVSVVQQIRDFYQLDLFQQPGLSCNEDLISHVASIEVPPLAEFVEVSRMGDNFFWKMNLPLVLSDRMSQTTISTNLTRHEINRLRHEFVSEALGLGGTDKCFDELYEEVDDGLGKLTPDYLVKDELGMIHCIEVATTRSTEEYQIKRVADVKLFKYKNAVFMRSKDIRSTLSVIIVNQHGVHSNIKLSQFLVDDLYIRFKVMIALENVGKERGFDIFIEREDEELNKIALDIEDQILQIEVDENLEEDGLHITKQFIEECLSPVDHEQVKIAFQTSVEATEMPERNLKKTEEDHAKELDLHKAKVRDMIKAYESEPDKRTRKCRPVLNVPKIIPAVTDPTTRVRFSAVGKNKENPELIRIWSEAMLQVNSGEKWNEIPKADLEVEAMETDKRRVEEIAQKRKKRMVERGRVSVKIKQGGELHKYLAKDGIKAKSTKDEAWRKQRKSEQSKTLSYNTDTLDISDFVNGKELYGKMESKQPAFKKPVRKLVAEANDIAGNNSEGLDVIDDWENTALMRYADFISELSSELTVSLSQFVKKEEFVLKKLRNYNCYLLAIPAGKKNPIGWSIMVPKTGDEMVLKELPGRPLVETTFCWISTFVTTMPDKLENMWNIQATMINMISFLGYFYNISDLKLDKCIKTPGFTESLNLLLAIRLEDKAETEETLTMTRYMYMEVMKTAAVLMTPDPFKMLDKFNIAPRSRLNLFLQKRIIECFLIMLKTPPKRSNIHDFESDSECSDPLPTDNWLGLMNFLDMKPVSSATKCLNLFYIGYLKNKNAIAQGNTNWLLLEKTIAEELKIDWADKQGYSGKARTDKIPKSHQFNLECIKAAFESLEKKLEATYGTEWKKTMFRKILQNLSRENSFRLATLKASSQTKDPDVFKKVNKTNNRPVRRRKFLEAVADNIKLFGINPFRKLRTFVSNRLKGSRKARADLFKKQQHGGLREIYVLDETTRVLQLFIEVCSRTLCKEFEEESLTNPKRKLPIINQHYRKTRKYAAASKRYCINSNSSLDKTRWNQGFMIRAIAVGLFRLLPKEMHGAIQNIMNMWIGKDIKIPPEVANMLLQDIRLSSKAYERLRQEFFGIHKFKENEKSIVRSPFNPYINIKSGFMQGILHYTSSLLHLAFLSLVKTILTKVLKKTCPGTSSLISFACSSDDSAIMISMFFPEGSKFFGRELITYSDTLERLIHSLEYFCRFYCMRPSVKSTVAMLDSVEFNSEFIFNNTLAIPVFKFVATCANSLPYESLIDKLNGHYNLLSSMTSSGYPSFNTHLCQLGQAFLHYKSLGAGLSPLDDQVLPLILEIKDPNYGFFPIDSCRAPGVMGLPYLLYRVSLTTGILPISPKHLKKDPIVSIEGGVPSESLQIHHGDRRKQKKLLLGLQQVTEGRSMKVVQPSNSKKFSEQLENVTNKIADEVNRNYELFYRAAEDENELIIKLKLKAMMPGVSKSLSSGNVHVQNTAASLYSSHTPCMKLNAERFSATARSAANVLGVTLEKKSMKVSLLKALRLRRHELSKLEDINRFQKDLESICFPLLGKYKEFDKVLKTFADAKEVEVQRFRSQKNRIELLPHKSRLPLSFLEVAKIRWFGHKNPTSQSVLNRCISIYEAMYPWFSQTHNDSLKASPFSCPTELFSFINSMNDGSRSIVINGPSIPHTGFMAQISMFIKKNYKQCTILRRPKEDNRRLTSQMEGRDRLNLSLYISDKDLLQEKVQEILSGGPLLSTEDPKTTELTRGELSLYFLQKYYKSGKDEFLDELNDYVNSSNAVYVVMYSLEQTKKYNSEGEMFWSGPGEAILKVGQDVLVVRLLDSNIIELRVQSLMSLTRNIKTLQDFMQELRVRPKMIGQSTFGAVAKFNGERVVSNLSVGCPVKVDQTIDVRYTRIKDCEIRFSRSRIGLWYTTGSSRWIRLFTYSCVNRPIDTSRQGPIKEDCWEAWITTSQWRDEKAIRTVRELKTTMLEVKDKMDNWRTKQSKRGQKNLAAIKEGLDNYKQFLSISLKTRIANVKSHRLFIDECLSSAADVKEEAEEFEVDDDFIFSVIGEGFEEDTDVYGELASRIKPDVNLENSIGLENDEITENIDQIICTLGDNADPGMKHFVDLLAPSVEDNPLSSVLYRRVTTEHTLKTDGLYSRQRSVYATHPLWDHLIHFLDWLDPRFISNMLDGIISNQDQETCKLLMWLLDIKERKERVKGLNTTLSAKDKTLEKVKQYLDKIGDDDSGEESA